MIHLMVVKNTIHHMGSTAPFFFLSERKGKEEGKEVSWERGKGKRKEDYIKDKEQKYKNKSFTSS